MIIGRRKFFSFFGAGVVAALKPGLFAAPAKGTFTWQSREASPMLYFASTSTPTFNRVFLEIYTGKYIELKRGLDGVMRWTDPEVAKHYPDIGRST